MYHLLYVLLLTSASCAAQCSTETITEGNYTGTGKSCKKTLRNSYGTKYEVRLRDGDWSFQNLDGVKYKKGAYKIDGDLSSKQGIWEFYEEGGRVIIKIEYNANRPVRIIALDSGVAYAGPDSIRVYSPDSINWNLDFAENGILKSWTFGDLGKWVEYNTPATAKKEYKPIIGIVGLQENDVDASSAPKIIKENIIWKDDEIIDIFPEIEPFIIDSSNIISASPNLIRNPEFLYKNKSLKDGTYVLSERTVDFWHGALESPDVFVKDGKAILGFRSAGLNYEVVGTELAQPLEAGKLYCASVQIRLKEQRIYALNRLGIWITANNGKKATRNEMGVEGIEIISPDEVPICLREGWMTIQGRFIAEGNEKYLYFGHFSDESNIRHWPLDSIYQATAFSGEIYYEMKNPVLKVLSAGESCPCNISDCPPEIPAPDTLAVAEDNFVLTSVQFETGKWNLLDIAFPALDSLAEYLMDNPTYELEIIGHTDDQGSASDNVKLSEKRAHEVLKYLEKKGVEKHRLTATGKGASDPIDDNDYEEGRQRNRRVEFTVRKI